MLIVIGVFARTIATRGIVETIREGKILAENNNSYEFVEIESEKGKGFIYLESQETIYNNFYDIKAEQGIQINPESIVKRSSRSYNSVEMSIAITIKAMIGLFVGYSILVLSVLLGTKFTYSLARV